MDHTIAVKPDGTLWAWGFNGSGQLGIGNTDEKNSPTQIGTATNWQTVSAGGNHSFAIKTDGTLWGWGDNFWGQVGVGTYGTEIYTPTKIGTSTNWKSISVGLNFTLGIKTDGTLWAWGENFFGQLGISGQTPSPVKVGVETNWQSVDTGNAHTMAIKTDGTLWGWGFNSYGQLGDGTILEKSTPQRIGSDGNWQSIATGNDFTMALKTDGTLWTWGSNFLGQLGDGTYIDKKTPTQIGNSSWKTISAGNVNSLAIKADGSLWRWGWILGEVGYGIENSNNIPTQLGQESNWQSISSGDKHSFAFKTDGTLWGWGDYFWGKLGIDGNLDFRFPQSLSTPTPTGEVTQIFCNSATVANLRATGTSIKWYSTASGGVALATNTILINGNHYYASQFSNSCESVSRLDVIVSINTTPTSPPTGSASQTFCGVSTIVNLMATGANLKWYTSATSTTTLSTTTALVNGNRYFASQTVNGCESTARLEVIVIVNNTSIPTGSVTQAFCVASTISNLAITGTNIKWYDVATGGSALPSSSPLINGSYYASQTINSCESSARFKVTVSLNITPTPAGQSTQYFCNSATISNLIATGTNIKWYNLAVGGSPLASTTQLIDGVNYYATQTLNSCESPARLSVVAAINTTSTNPPTGSAAQTVCNGSTIASLIVNGIGLKWYSGPTGGSPLPLTELLADSRYYVSQTINACESSSRLEVLVSVYSVPMPTRVGGYGWKTLSAGYLHTLAIMNDGTLWAWGNNQYGQLGDGTTTNQNLPTLISNETNWKSVFEAVNSSMAQKEDGSIWEWGLHNNSIPTQIGSDNDWKVLSTSGSHTLAIKTDGTLWAWGANYYGQLGDGTRIGDKNMPIQIGVENDWKSVSAGGTQSVAIKNDKTMWTWGRIGVSNSQGITIPTELDFYSGWESVSAGYSHILAIRSDGTLWAWGNNEHGQLGNGKPRDSESSPNKIGTDSDWMLVSGGALHSAAIKKDGSAWGWGSGLGGYETLYSAYEPIRVGTISDWKSISAGGNHTIALKKDGSLWAWGDNIYGQLGDETNQWSNIAKKIEAPQQRFCPGAKVENLLAEGTDVKWYNSSVGGTILPATTPLVHGNFYYASQTIDLLESCSRLKVRIIIGETPAPTGSSNQSFCSGSLLSDLNIIGTNIKWYNAAIGGSALNSSTGLQNGQDYFASQTIDLCESNVRLKVTVSLNSNSTAPPSGLPLQSFCHDATVSQLSAIGEKIKWYKSGSSASELSSTEILEDGQTYFATQTIASCESIARLQVGTIVAAGAVPPPIEGVGVKWNSVSTMSNSNLALRSDGTLFGWRGNNFGELGIGLSFPYHSIDSLVLVESAVPWVSLGVGYYHSVGIKADGSLWAWGDNHEFQSGLLGDGKKVSKSLPIQIGTDNDWRFVAVSSQFSAAIKHDGTLWSWGRNVNGQLGDGTNTERNVPVQIGKDTDWASVSLGLHHTLALKSDGTLWAWGGNPFGELGDGTLVDKNTPQKIGTSSWKFISAGAYRSFAINTDGTLWAWGNNLGGRLGDGTYVNRVIPKQIGIDVDWKSIALGLKYGHVLALKTDGTLWGWGENRFGELGNGIFSDIQLIKPNKIGDADWESVSVGYDHSIGVKKDGTLWQWGSLISSFIYTNYNTPQLVQPNTNKTIQTFCFGATIASLKVTGSDVRWYNTKTSGVPLPNTTLLTNGSHYFAEQSNGVCYSNSRLEVIVYIPTQPPTGSATQYFCKASDSEITIGNLVASGNIVQWYSEANGGIRLSATTIVVNGARYYASQTVKGCESQARLEVLVILNSTPTPSGTSTQIFCSTASVSNLTAMGTGIKWFASAAGGVALTSNTLLTNGSHYYASQTINSCESSSRLDVAVQIIGTSAPTGVTSQSFCNGAIVNSLVAAGSNIKWYATSTGGIPLSVTTRLVNGSHYYASQTTNSCESNSRLNVTAVINTTVAPGGASTQYFCSSSTIANLIAYGANIKWYASASGGTPLAITTPLVSGNHYYASQTLNSCESLSRLDATALISVAPTGASTQTFCSSATVANLVVNGTGIKWYASATGGTPLVITTALVNGSHYYASQTVNSCESPTRLDVTAFISLTAIPTGASSQNFCQGATVAALSAAGTNIKWYANSFGGNQLSLNTLLVNNAQYFATQTLSGCESTTRLIVSVKLNPMPSAPTGASTQFFESGKTISDLVASGTGVKWYGSSNEASTKTNPLPAAQPLVNGTTYFATQTISGCESNGSLAVTVSIITGIELGNSLLEYYPNPVKDFLTITVDYEIETVTVINMVGQKVITKMINDTHINLDMTELEGSIYLIHLQSKDKIASFKVMKQ